MIGKWSPPNMEKFVMVNTVQELFRLKEDHDVIFVPFRPDVLSRLIDLTPINGVFGEKFSQPKFSEACSKLAEEMGVKAAVSIKSINNYCNGRTKPDAAALEVMGKALGVFLVPGLDSKVDPEQILDYLKTLYS